MKSYLVFLLLLAIKALSRIFYRHELSWIGEPPEDPWSNIRILALLHHTSLYEPLFIGAAPNRLLWRVARHGVVPVARKTSRRPLVGSLFRLVGHRVIPITRERDETWAEVVRHAAYPKALLVILPEGRMMRRSGLDSEGNPMTVRGGMADILRTVSGGRMLLAYSGGLHHVHAPGDRLPRLFRTLRIRLELLEIEAYLRELRGAAEPVSGTAHSSLESGGADAGPEEAFKAAVVMDLSRRRDLHRPSAGAASPSGSARPSNSAHSSG